jgi:uncharacterized DUF497 family protein
MRETGFALRFHWDPVKARTNLVKHGVSFEQASSVFRDPLATTIYDPEHSEEEERWLTLGRASTARYLVVCHTWRQTDPGGGAKIRIISARPATKPEIRNYEENQS